jgi:hypothetical protein
VADLRHALDQRRGAEKRPFGRQATTFSSQAASDEAGVLSFSPHVRVYLASQRVNMRCGHDGPFAIVKSWDLNPFSGYLFAFIGKNADRAKILGRRSTESCRTGTRCRYTGSSGRRYRSNWGTWPPRCCKTSRR